MMKVQLMIFLILIFVGFGWAQNPQYELMGDTICSGSETIIDVKVMNFQNMSSTQFSVSWDSVLLEYVEVLEINPLIINPIFNINFITAGKLGFSWIDLTNEGITLEEESILFKIKLITESDTAAISNLIFENEPVLIEAIQMFMPVEPELIHDSIQLLHPFVSTLEIEPSTTGTMNGSIAIEVSGGMPPYFFSWTNGASTQNITDLANGNYFCTISDQFQCANIVGPFLVDLETASIDMELSQNFQISPNPLVDQLNVKATFNQIEKGNWFVVNVHCQTIFTESFQSDFIDAAIDLDEKPQGIYFVIIEIAGKRMMRKFIL